MSQSNMKLAAAGSLAVSPEDDGAWYGGGLKTPRKSGPAPRGSTVRSVPPPPPAAAFAHPARGASGRAPRLHEPAFQLPVVPLPSSVEADWTAFASSHFGNSVRPAEKPGVNWSRVSAIGLSAAALVGGLYTAILMDNAHRAYASETRALSHIEALEASQPTAARLPPAQPPGALAAIGPISLERDLSETRSANLAAPSAAKSASSNTGVTGTAAQSVTSSARAAEAAVQSSTSSSRPAEAAAQSSTSSSQPAEAAAQSSNAHAGAASGEADESREAAASDAGEASERASSSKKNGARRHARSEAASGETATESAAGASPNAKPLTAASHENLPEKLTRQQVMTGLESVRAALAMCVVPAHGTTYANVTIANTGKVTYSQVEGAFAGTTQGSCMARVLRGAAFPRFSSESFKVRYPFVF